MLSKIYNISHYDKLALDLCRTFLKLVFNQFKKKNVKFSKTNYI